MPKLFTYIVSADAGAAPNPFGGMCTLAICKPAIRRSAQVDDWVAGVGSRNAPSGNLSGRLVYAMKVAESIPLDDYDGRAPKEWPHRIPDVTSLDMVTRLGDCIYDYSSGRAKQRKGVHRREHMVRDLGGENVLISRDFYYFGSSALKLPASLQAICPTTQGHRSTRNQDYLDDFVSWLRGLNLPVGQLYGWPDYIVDWPARTGAAGCLPCVDDDDAEEC